MGGVDELTLVKKILIGLINGDVYQDQKWEMEIGQDWGSLKYLDTGYEGWGFGIGNFVLRTWIGEVMDWRFWGGEQGMGIENCKGDNKWALGM